MTDRHGIAFIADARKRRERRGLTPDPPQPRVPEQPEPEDYSAALNMADGALVNDHEAGPLVGADAILAQHEAATIETPAGGGVTPEPEAPADEILRKLEGHHQQGEPHQRYAAPRGSADLDPRQPQRPRVKPVKARKTRTAARPRRRWLAAGAIASVLVVIGIAVGTSNSSPTIPKPTSQQTGQRCQSADREPRRRQLPRPRPAHRHAPQGNREAAQAGPPGRSSPQAAGGRAHRRRELGRGRLVVSLITDLEQLDREQLVDRLQLQLNPRCQRLARQQLRQRQLRGQQRRQ